MIPYGRQTISDSDVSAVSSVLRSDFLTQGEVVLQFEHAVADEVNVGHAVAVNSGTSALHLSCSALGLGPGDWLWTSPNTFVASANCGRYCGAKIDFVDIEPTSWNMSIPALREKLIQAERHGFLPKVVVPVHFGGQPTGQKEIWELAKQYGFRVVEDASHSFGASNGGEPVGSCRWSDIAVFSFHPVKTVTTGEGGMAVTNDGELAQNMARLRSHGVTRDPEQMSGCGPESSGSLPHAHCPPAWYYEQQDLGFNYRMTDIQAALGLSQLSRLEEFVGRRRTLAERYQMLLADLPIELPVVRSGVESAHHLYVIRLIGPEGENLHRHTHDELRRMGIGVNLHYYPVHLQPYYRKLGFSAGQFPEAERHGRSAITIPLYPTLTESQQNRVVEAVSTVLKGT
jgi:UDP-4-amino-4,6-dideoxy-N-acetyl-beta-L-altrosamine transaminase